MACALPAALYGLSVPKFWETIIEHTYACLLPLSRHFRRDQKLHACRSTALIKYRGIDTFNFILGRALFKMYLAIRGPPSSPEDSMAYFDCSELALLRAGLGITMSCTYGISSTHLHTQ